MSLVDWYLHKADQCARLAQGTTDRRQLAGFEDERRPNPKIDAARFN